MPTKGDLLATTVTDADAELRALLRALERLNAGDGAVRLPEDWNGTAGEVAKLFNRVASQRASHGAAPHWRVRPRFSRTGAPGESLNPDQIVTMLNALLALKRGDDTVRLPVDWPGVAGKVADAFNDVVELNVRKRLELARLSREVGKEGKLKERASMGEVTGFWRESVDAVNSLIANLVYPQSEVARVIGAVAEGDLSKSMALDVDGRPLEGEFQRTAHTINTMVDQLRSFAAEVTRVVREVGSEGRLGGRADVEGVAGTWRDLTDGVNCMAGNLTAQVRNIAEVTTAVARGDLSKKITVDVKGELLELKNTINTMVDQLVWLAAEVTRVAREVGTEGKLGGQADVQGVSGTWKDLTESVNSMAGNLTDQVRNIADVTTAVARGDLSKKITVDVKGELLELKNTINTMVDQLGAFASEVTRVAREVGTEGKLGGQADVQGVAGTWKDLTDGVNSMAGNLKAQVRNIAEVTKAVAMGDLSKKITVDVKGEILELKDTINTMVSQLRSFAAEVTRVAREVGTDGKLGGQADVQGVAGTWKDLTDSVNSMAGNLTAQVRNIAEVTKAVAMGDLSKKIAVDVKGEILELKNIVNTMVDQLRTFAGEVTRVAREVGTEGKLGGQAAVEGVAGTWKDLTDSVNFMAANLTDQVRGIARVVTAVANGDLKHKLAVEAKGEIAALADTINGMTDTLATFAEQVTTVAREVGVEGRLGGQAKVPGAAGTWKALTENVNQLAANLTTQVRAIAEVAVAVTQGDLTTRSITVDAQGEVAVLKDTINEMIRNLRDTTRKNTEQDWLKTNLAKFSRLLQGQKNMVAVGQMILSELAPVVGAQQAEIYVRESGEPRLKLLASYASGGQGAHGKTVELGQGLIGQVALSREKVLLEGLSGTAIRVVTGVSEWTPSDILVLPIVFEGEVKGVLELASVERFSPSHQAFLSQLTESIGIVINTIEAYARTEDLLEQSQSLANELQRRQEELQRTNEDLQDKALLLAQRNEEVERKNHEVEQARQALEDKAVQLARTSKYKSEFLANMSHELRTPLNSLLILSDQLCQNRERNLTERQVEFAKTIHSSGNDLLALINDILDLSKIESGTVVVDVSEVRFEDLQRYVERTFRPIAESRSLDFLLRIDPRLPKSMVTDAKRLQQILKNLLSNALKFTHQGGVTLAIEPARTGWDPANDVLSRAAKVVAFQVTDTGIGIPADKQQIIFEAFHQADGGISRKYAGTGLGLAISRELSRLLGGEITLVSTSGRGSSFTLYLPTDYAPPRLSR
ncbi:MAG: HAMP domain-containing protein, partial [Hyphomicrobiaceae bacterium]|nr:HAMP domain-containing protein [Hyphomicrobiaceae bacterium]